MNTLWWRGGRWIWGGRFELGRQLGRGEEVGERPHTENPNISGEVFSVEGWEGAEG